MRQLIVDTETTGLDVVKGHRIIEFAALEMVDRRLTGNSLHLYINPERSIDEGAARIHGITDDDVRDKPTFSHVVNEIVNYIADAELIIHNAKFDLGFLNYQFNLENVGVVDQHVAGVIDTLVLSRQKFPGSKNNLDALCDRFSVNRTNRGYHGALIDCHLLAEVYLALTREQISLLGNDEANNKKMATNVFEKIDTTGLNLKIIHPNNDENVQHDAYLSILDKISHGKSTWFNLSK